MITFYKSEWGGDFGGSDEELKALLFRAEIFVNNAVMMSGVTVETSPEALKKPLYSAVCAQADYIAESGGVAALSELSEQNSGGSVTLGKFSYSGGNAQSGGSLCGLCPQAVSLLESTGLLYKGVCVL